MNLVEAGQYYLKRGMSVFPFKRDKSAGCVTWTPYQTHHPSQDDVKKWFEKRFSNQFIAIVTGKISNIMVVDCDTPEAYQKINDLLPDGFITPTAKSPHGWHLYFKFKEGLKNKAAYMPGVDVRTEGGCIIAPPSMNGDGLGYKWLSGLSIEKVDIATMPENLFLTLLQYTNKTVSLYNSPARAFTEGELSTTDNKVYNCLQYFNEGSRDQDVFHIANCLVKGKCENDIGLQALKIIGKNCNPPFDEKDVEIKWQSALSRKHGRERNLAAEVLEWVLSTNGNFLSTNIYKDLQVSTRDERKNVSIILKRLETQDKVIEKVGNKNGEFKLRDNTCEELDWINADCSYKPLWLPLGLDEVFGAHPGNVIMIAGAKDSGKTEWLLNIAKMNRYTHKIHYFNSEMGPAEFKQRAMNFKDVSIQQWKDVKVYERYNDFHAVIKPGEGNLNIIDFIEITDEFWKIGSAIRKIHEALKGAICIIGLQKKKGAEYGRGAEFSIEKARLYISLDYGLAKIVSCKNYRPESTIGNGRGYTCNFTVKRKCEILFNDTSGWTKPLDK